MRSIRTPGFTPGSMVVRLVVLAILAAATIAVLGGASGKGGKGKGGTAGGPSLPLKTTLDDFFLPGTQPDPTGLYPEPVWGSENCSFCHGLFEEASLPPQAEPYRNWVASMMGQAGRDPMFYACLTIANQDLGQGGDLCLRCHAPAAWLAGRSTPTDGSGMGGGLGADFDGVTCHFCHRLIDPVYSPGVSPIQDQPILTALANEGALPLQPHTGTYIIDPTDNRRAPRDPSLFPVNPHGSPILQSPFHKEGDLCGTCHDVSNPAFMKQPGGNYILTALDAPHPTQNKYDMFPVERTYSEWKMSQFANGGVQLNGLFGGNHPTGVMESCQDCHMPKVVSPGCIVEGFPIWQDMPQHAFNGANSWVLRAIYDEYTFESGLNQTWVDEAVARNIQMLRDASTMTLTQQGANLKVKVTNWSGHKLPTGYPEGRRMWVNVRFLNAANQLVAERGAYNQASADLSTSDTKVYEMKLGLDAYMSGQTGLPAGESFHFILNNTILKDNRIPPVGFTNAGFASVQSSPVAYTYADGQHWDETLYAIPVGATKAVVTLYHQTTSKEYVTFLRDQNKTDNRGQYAYDLWEEYGRSAPVDMDSGMINLTPANPADLDGNGLVNGVDLGILLNSWSIPPKAPGCGGALSCPADINNDGRVNGVDLGILLNNWTL